MKSNSDKIDRVEIQGDRLSVTSARGKTVHGKFLMPTTQPAEVRVLGITDKYDAASPQVFDLFRSTFPIEIDFV
jgi:hypothetical protein